EDQQSVVERALVESRRVHEMVWEMEAQIGKLNEGGKRTARVEEMLARIDRTVAETAARQEEATRARESFCYEVNPQHQEAQTVVEALQQHVGHLAVNRQELDTIQERLRVAQATIGGAEARVQALADRTTELDELKERMDSFSTLVQDASAN